MHVNSSSRNREVAVWCLSSHRNIEYFHQGLLRETGVMNLESLFCLVPAG